MANFRVAFVIALCASLFTAMLTAIDQFLIEPEASSGVRHVGIEFEAYGLFSSMLGLLLTFRTGQAYSRFWGGILDAYEVTGGLFRVASNLMAFADFGKATEKEVLVFRHRMARLVSLLSAMMLSQLEGKDSLNAEQGYDLLDVDSLDMTKVRVLSREKAMIELADT